MQARWMIKNSKEDIIKLAKLSGISETICRILVNRGVRTPPDIAKFLNPSLKDLESPMLMKDMKKGIDIVETAVKNNKKIVVYGDYDADGVTSTVILYKALIKCGANCTYYIPARETEGYGMSSSRISKLKAQGVDLIITCDNGIAAIAEIALAKELGFTVVVTDHHEQAFEEDESGQRKYVLPNADAVINPKQQGCSYPFKNLCGAGVAYKFVEELYKVFSISENNLIELRELAAIGTICDIVELKGENRIIVKTGLDLINSTQNKGLKALIEENGLQGKKLAAYHIGYVLGPCINATGRLDTASLSVELLLEEDNDRVIALAHTLRELNSKRQSMTTESVEAVKSKIENSQYKNDKVMVVYDEDVHESIAGIVAGKIKELYNLPTIVITKGNDMAKGSGRSIEGYNLFEELLACKNLLSKFGGHTMAAGLSIEKEKIDELRIMLNKNCKLTPEDLIPKILIDERISLSMISIEFIHELEKLEPFGQGNRSPILAQKNVKVENIRILGKDKNTLKLTLVDGNSRKRIDALGFGQAQLFKEMLETKYQSQAENVLNNPVDLRLDIVFYPSLNEFQSNVTAQLRLINFRL